MEEAGGINLYGFVNNSPANAYDVLGFDAASDAVAAINANWMQTGQGVIGGGGGQQDALIASINAGAASMGNESAVSALYNNENLGQPLEHSSGGGPIDLGYAVEGFVNGLFSGGPSTGGSTGGVRIGALMLRMPDGSVVPLTLANFQQANGEANSAGSNTSFTDAPSGTGAVEVGAGAAEVASHFATGTAQELQAAGQFALAGTAYKAGFYGNKYIGAEAVAAAKAEQATIAGIGGAVSKGVALVGVGVAAYEIYEGGASNQSLAKGVGSLVITGAAFIPVVGPFLSLGLALANTAGAFNGIYNSYSNTARMSGAHP